MKGINGGIRMDQLLKNTILKQCQDMGIDLENYWKFYHTKESSYIDNGIIVEYISKKTPYYMIFECEKFNDSWEIIEMHFHCD